MYYFPLGVSNVLCALLQYDFEVEVWMAPLLVSLRLLLPLLTRH